MHAHASFGGPRAKRCPELCRPPLVVSLLDGSIAAVDEATGKQLWRYRSDTALVANRGTAVSKGGGEATIIPGADGSLYAYHHTDETFEVPAPPAYSLSIDCEQSADVSTRTRFPFQLPIVQAPF